MSIFSRMRDGRAKNSLAGSAWRFNLGASIAGKPVTERTAMQMTAVYACVRILAESIAGLPLHVYRYKDQGKEKAIDHPLYALLHDEPNPEMTSFVFREALMSHLLLWGNAYAQVIRNGKGEVTALYPLLPNRMTVDRDEHGRLYYRYQYNGQKHVDGTTGSQLSFTNLLILCCDHAATGDEKGHITVDTTGSGSGFACMGGRYVRIRWSKPTVDSVISFTYADGGAPLTLSCGKTMINIVSPDVFRSVTFR